MKLSGVVICLALCLGCSALANAADSEQTSFSRANTLLFYTDHLANVSVPSTLRYTFMHRGQDREAFSDTIELRVSEASTKDQKNVAVNYFTGDRRQYVPPLTNAEGNPVLKVFLQREIHEMGRLTQGPWRHFQKRIKHALAEDASITAVTFDFKGTLVHGHRIRIDPYRNDPKRLRFARYAHKFYEFTLSEDVPGMIYTIHAVVPDDTQTQSNNSSKPLMESVLRYQRVAE